MTLRLGVARLAERSTRCASVPKRGKHSALCDGGRRLPAGGGRVSIKASFSHTPPALRPP